MFDAIRMKIVGLFVFLMFGSLYFFIKVDQKIHPPKAGKL